MLIDERETESDESVYVRLVECMPSLDEANEALSLLYLQCASVSSAQDGRGVWKKENYEDSKAAGEWFKAIPF